MIVKNGFYIINKKANISSFGVVAALRKRLNIKKIGHCGTLDPEAKGVLVVAINQATKIIEYLVSDDKKYQVTFELGKTSDSFDIWGAVSIDNNYQNLDISDANVIEAINSFDGLLYDQTPPIYSAIKVNGQRLYQYARNNQEVEIKSRPVMIKKIENIKKHNSDSWTFDCLVSKGTYIRSLINDIGKKLNTGAVMSDLIRTNSGSFSIDQAIDISQANGDTCISIEKVWPYDIIRNIEPINLKKLKHGQKCRLDLKPGISLLVVNGHSEAVLITENQETKVHKGMWYQNENI